MWPTACTSGVGSEEDRLCRLVLIGAHGHGTMELIAVKDGYRESAEISTDLRNIRCRSS